MSKSKERIGEWSKRSWQTLDFSAGRALERSEARKLEQMLAEDPADVTARVLLLGYYERDARSVRNKAYKTYLNHLLWLIEHHPWHDQHEHAGIFAEALSLGGVLEADTSKINDLVRQDLAAIEGSWRQAINQYPDNVQVLGNAAHFFEILSRETAVELRTKIKLLEPDNESL